MTSPGAWWGAGLPGFADALAATLGQDASDRAAMDRFTREALACVPGRGRPVAGIGLNGGGVDWRFRGDFVGTLGERGRVFGRTDDGFVFVAFRDLAVTTRLESGKTVVTPVKRVWPSDREPSVEDCADQANDAWLDEEAVARRRAGEREEAATRVLRARILDVMAAAPEGTLVRARVNRPSARMEDGSMAEFKGLEGADKELARLLVARAIQASGRGSSWTRHAGCHPNLRSSWREGDVSVTINDPSGGSRVVRAATSRGAVGRIERWLAATDAATGLAERVREAWGRTEPAGA